MWEGFGKEDGMFIQDNRYRSIIYNKYLVEISDLLERNDNVNLENRLMEIIDELDNL